MVGFRHRPEHRVLAEPARRDEDSAKKHADQCDAREVDLVRRVGRTFEKPIHGSLEAISSAAGSGIVSFSSLFVMGL
jgi:hypothetical protein